MTRRIWIAALTLTTLFAAEIAAAQQMAPRSWGLRGGYRIGEKSFDQFVVGAHADLGDVSTNLRFAPNVHLGLGSDVTIVSLNPELQYVFRDTPVAEDANFYAGGGLGIHILNFERPEGAGTGRDTETDVKVNLSAGIEKRSSDTIGYFGEFRLSFVDGTWFDFLGGINFLR